MRAARCVPALTFFFAIASVAANAGERAVDTAHSVAKFGVQHVYVQHVDGSVPILSGDVTFGASETVPTSLTATLDPAHVATDDPDRDQDLQGPDWFDTKKFPTWTYASTSIVANTTGFTVNGTLTVHGVAQPVALTVTSFAGRYHAIGHASRKAFGMKRTPFDGLIGDDVTITLDVALKP